MAAQRFWSWLTSLNAKAALAGTEETYINDGGVSKKTTVADFVDSQVGKGPFLTGDNTLFDDLRIPGFSVRASGGTPPDFESGFQGDSSLYRYNFNGVNTVEEVFFDLQLPHGWKEGSTIYPHVHFSPTSTNSSDAVSRTVRFVLEYTWANVNATFGATAEYEMTKDFVPNTSQWAHLVAGGSGISGTGKTLSSILMCRLYRDPTNAGDTYPQDVSLLSFDVHFELAGIGSREQWSN